MTNIWKISRKGIQINSQKSDYKMFLVSRYSLYFNAPVDYFADEKMKISNVFTPLVWLVPSKWNDR